MKKNILRLAVIVFSLVVVALISFWAGRNTLQGIKPSVAKPADSTYTASTQEIGTTVPVSIKASRNVKKIAVNSLTGTVTKITTGIANSGDEIYRVNGIPVIAIEGNFPFYRELNPETTGEDVEQLENYLVSIGLLWYADQKYDAYTTAAVKKWQLHQGVEQTGVVADGTLIAFPTLPTAFSLGEDIQLANKLSGGETAVLVGETQTEFALITTAEQLAQFLDETKIEIIYGDKTWSAIARKAEAKTDPNNTQINLPLAAVEGNSICADECNSLAIKGEEGLQGEAQIVPPLKGIGIPQSYINFISDETGIVQLKDGSKAKIEVLGTGNGIAIVKGLKENDEIVLPEE